MIKKLRRKFIMINMLLVTIVLAVTFGAIYYTTAQQVSRESNDMMLRLLNENNKGFPVKPDETPPKYDSKGGFDIRIPISAVAVQLDISGNIVSTVEYNMTVSDVNALEEMAAKARSAFKTRNYGILPGGDFRFAATGNAQGTMIILADRSNEVARLTSLVQRSLLIGAGSLAAFYLISLLLAGWAVRPIERSLAQQRQFVADASHELKTPVTVILANANVVLGHKDEAVASQEKWIEYIKAEAQRMGKLINDMLYLAKSDDSRGKPLFARFSLSDAVWSAVLPFEPVAFEQGKSLTSAIDADIFTMGDEARIKQLTGILLDNAVKYAGEGGSVRVALTREHDKAKLVVRNTGEPIPADELEHIFKRFYRVDKSRAREEHGYGLGLSIAKSIADDHRARITVTSCAEEGTTFTVTLASK